MRNVRWVGSVWFGIAVVLLAGGVLWASGEDEDQKKRGKRSNELFEVRNIEGWTVYINKKDLAEHEAEMSEPLEHLGHQFYQIRLNVPSAALAKMQEEVPVWVEYDTLGIAYHGWSWLVGNGYDCPDVDTMAGFCRMKSFLHGALDQPWVVFHELAHGYDFRYVQAGKHGINQIMNEAFEQAKASGKYDAVLCRYSDSTKHYALTSRAEYFSENSEAYFGANDFYPFVRAELKEYDPKWYAALEDAWGVDREVQKRNTNALTRFIDSTDKPKSKKSSSRKSRGRYAPTKQYDQRQIEGWTVYVSKQLHKRMGYCQEMCKLLRHKLHLIKRYVPEAAVKELQKVPIWLELNDEHVRYMTYHSDAELLKKNEQNPDKLGAVEIGNVRNFRLWQDLQPSMVLHQLAYGYYDRVVGSDNARLKEIYQKAVDGGKYDSVLRFDGKHVRHPALTDVKEYFAEMSEARFGINDHYPFIRFELKQCDSEAHEVISALWKAEGEPATARKKE